MSIGLYELSRLYERYIDELITTKQGVLSQGSAPDFAAYKHECGIILGLIQSKLELKDLIKRLSREDEEERDD